MKRRRVKITGIGPVTPAGIGREAFWKGILEPISRVRPYNKIGEEFGPFVAAQIAGFDAKKYIGESDLPKGSARHTMFAVAASMLALEDAGISRKELKHTHSAVVTGSSLLDFGGIGHAIEAVQKLGVRGAKPRVVYTTTLTAIPDVINAVCGITARTMSVQTSCCSGIDAIGHAANLVGTGEVEIAICGGTESPLHRFPLLELRAAGLTPTTTEMSERLARPFDQWRTTGVVSEGACMFVLEPESSVRPGYSYVTGYAFANDEPNELCGGIATAGRLAIAEARLRPAEIEAISAWAPGHKLIDEGEARALSRIFGSILSEIPVVSIKGAIGAALGAAPAIQVGAAALSQRYGVIPPTVNWEYADPACPLNLSNKPRSIMHTSTLVNAHGVGNVNASLILERC
jgi:3-oxoacyl-(acyl-carrier-protein) synthase